MAGRKSVDFDAETVEWFYKRGVTREDVENKSDFYFALRWALNNCQTDQRTNSYYFYPSELRKCGRFKHSDSFRIEVIVEMLTMLNVITGSLEIPSGGRPRLAYTIARKFMNPGFMEMPSSHLAWLELFCNRDLWCN